MFFTDSLRQPVVGADFRTTREEPIPGQSAGRKGVVYYLCLQATREGQASHAHVHEIIAGLRRRGWEVTLFEPGYAADDRRVGLFRRSWNFATMQIRLCTAGVRPDVLYVRSHQALLPALALAKIRGISIILEVNGTFEDISLAYPWTRLFWPLVVWIGRQCFHAADAIIAVTPPLCDWVKLQVGQKAMFVVPNGANIDLFRPDAPRHELLSGPYVTFVGALSRWQGIETLLQAAMHPEWPKEVKLVIVGNGTERSKVEEAAARNPAVIYLGQKPYSAVPGIIAGGLAGLSPQTNSQGRADYGLYPLKVFETLSCGVPVIVTDFSGQRDIIQAHDCGLVVPADDPLALARAVNSIYQQPERGREMGERGRCAVQSNFSWQHRADATEAVIEQVQHGKMHGSKCM